MTVLRPTVFLSKDLVLNGLLCQCIVSVIHDLLLHNCHVELSGMASIATKSISDVSIVFSTIIQTFP